MSTFLDDTFRGKRLVNDLRATTTDDSDTVVAAIVLLQTRPETIEIVNIAVPENCQGRGIGRKLINFAIHKAREQNTKTIE